MSIVSKPSNKAWDRNYALVWEEREIRYCPLCERRLSRCGKAWACPDGCTAIKPKETEQ
jgi:hypothetical protein